MPSPSGHIDGNVLLLVFNDQHGFKFTMTEKTQSKGVEDIHDTHENWPTVSDAKVDAIKTIAGTIGCRMLPMNKLMQNDHHCYFVGLNENFAPIILLQCDEANITIFELKQVENFEEIYFADESDDEEEY